MAKRFANLRAEIDADPERRARVEEYKRAIYDALALAALREPNGGTPEEQTHGLTTPSAKVSSIGPEHGPYLSALEGYVADLGGRLEVRAVFPDEVVPLLCGGQESTDFSS